MRRKQNIEDAFHSVVPEGTAGAWSVGYSGHTDNSSFFAAPDFKITAIRNVTSPVSVMNDVYIDYSGSTISGTTSIYVYPDFANAVQTGFPYVLPFELQ